tara:strand:+ start:995 stop:1216 length:222 start_codon:yes stop_codon:yes gene_type:complete
MKKIFLFLLLYFSVFLSESFAYFDPGTGAFIIQAILGFLAAVVASLTMTWNRVKMFFEKIFRKKSKSKKKEDK